MGRERGRGATLTPALTTTLTALAEAMADAREQWWVIGSAAVLPIGGEAEVADVDVLLSVGDARIVAERLGLVAARGGEHPLFRSTLFFSWQAPPLVVEFMAGFAVASGGPWRPVAPLTRERVAIGDVAVFAPACGEMREILASFGRPKDLARLAALPEA